MQNPPPPRHFREEDGAGDEPIEAASYGGQLPLEVHMTDEPGGDPYNHTGRFRRMFR